MSAADGRRDASALERAFYGDDVEVLVPSDRREMAEILRQAEAEGRTVVPAGEGAHAGAADPPPPEAIVVSTAAFDAIETYRPDDFTVGVGAGVGIATLRATLRGHGQEIPVDTAARGGGTVGGLAARAPAGPRLGRYGALTTFVLGVEGMSGGGRGFRSGGLVVKNVAGYAISKLLVGSLGAAGVLLRVNFKLRPLPARRRLGIAFFAKEEAAWAWAAELRASGREPAALTVLLGDRGGLAAAGLPDADGRSAVAWVFEGNAATVDWLARETEATLSAHDAEPRAGEDDEAERFLDFLAALAETEGRVLPDTGIVRAAVLPSALASAVGAVREFFRDHPAFRAVLAGDPATGLLTVRWTGPANDVAAPVTALRDAARARDGSGRILYLPPEARGRFRHRLTADPNATLTESILRAFDPQRIFARRSPKGAAAGADA